MKCLMSAALGRRSIKIQLKSERHGHLTCILKSRWDFSAFYIFLDWWRRRVACVAGWTSCGRHSQRHVSLPRLSNTSVKLSKKKKSDARQRRVENVYSVQCTVNTSRRDTRVPAEGFRTSCCRSACPMQHQVVQCTLQHVSSRLEIIWCSWFSIDNILK